MILKQAHHLATESPACVENDILLLMILALVMVHVNLGFLGFRMAKNCLVLFLSCCIVGLFVCLFLLFLLFLLFVCLFVCSLRLFHQLANPLNPAMASQDFADGIFLMQSLKLADEMVAASVNHPSPGLKGHGTYPFWRRIKRKRWKDKFMRIHDNYNHNSSTKNIAVQMHKSLCFVCLNGCFVLGILAANMLRLGRSFSLPSSTKVRYDAVCHHGTASYDETG